jgi:BirA family transcriptional regulator, biotin operon repressor / biotin---[acetyl-CoA-carboxylase] ligase
LLSEHDLRNALERAGLEAPVRSDEVTRSTQETALALASAGAPQWSLVAAAHQTAGRGRLGRLWTDEPGRALMFSFVLRPEILPERGGLLTLLAGAALAEAVRVVAGVAVRCKWPNDLIVERGKVAGVLAGSEVTGDRFEYVVLGIGVNLDPPPDVPGAAGLGACDAADLLAEFLVRFRFGYEHPDGIIDTYKEVCVTLGEDVRATTTDGRTIEGRAVDIDETGSLIIETESRREVVRSGEVLHLRL